MGLLGTWTILVIVQQYDKMMFLGGLKVKYTIKILSED